MTAWQWQWSAGALPPSTGQVETDTQNWSSATQVALWSISDDGTDHSADFALMRTGDFFRIQNLDVSKSALFKLSGPGVAGAGFYTFPVILINSVNIPPPPADGSTIRFFSKRAPSVPTTPGQKAYAGWVASVTLGNPNGSAMQWANLSPVEVTRWEAAGKAAQT